MSEKNSWRDNVNIALTELKTIVSSLLGKIEEFSDSMDNRLKKVEKIIFGNGDITESLNVRINNLEYKIKNIETFLKILISSIVFLISLLLYLMKDIIKDIVIRKIL